MLPLLLYTVGAAPEAWHGAVGDYRDWFERLGRPHGIRWSEYDGRHPRVPPHLDECAGVVITGSAASLTHPEPWMEAAVDCIHQARQLGVPVLGVCFGHQLVGVAAGAMVVENPNGWEVATTSVTLTDAGVSDPLFRGVETTFEANQAHRDIVDPDLPSLPFQVLGSNAKAAAQAIAVGDSIRGIQFHPEFDGRISRLYVDYRYQDLATDAADRHAPEDHPDRRASRDCPEAESVFANFVRYFAAKS